MWKGVVYGLRINLISLQQSMKTKVVSMLSYKSLFGIVQFSAFCELKNFWKT